MKLTIFLTLSISVFICRAQSLEKTLSLANELYANKSYQNALEVYNRVLYFDTNQVFYSEIYPKIADSYFNTAQYYQANLYYDLAYVSSEDNVQKNEFLLQKISGYLILQEYDFADIDYLNVDSTSLNATQTKRLTLLGAILKFSKADYAKSEEEFLKISTDSLRVKALFEKNKKVSKLSPEKAKTMSRIIPGLGQIYAGDWKNGLNSFVLTGGLLALGIRGTFINGPLDAAFAVLPWLQRYYKGGYAKAETIAFAKIQERRFKIYNQLLDNVSK
jgi:tetratricopeptide (TPR) repeat protein